jgi:23S rRNA (pseudouridine1915-N3)-methyltransferase
MRRYSFIWIGKSSDSSIQDLISTYQNKLKPFANIEFIEIKEKKHRELEKLKALESEELEKRIPQNSIVFLLDETGKELSSIAFSKQIEKRSEQFGNHFTFIIGGAFGFSDAFKAKYQDHLSLSKMTFTHDMVRVFLLEQVYRAEMILKGSKYHHE